MCREAQRPCADWTGHILPTEGCTRLNQTGHAIDICAVCIKNPSKNPSEHLSENPNEKSFQETTYWKSFQELKWDWEPERKSFISILPRTRVRILSRTPMIFLLRNQVKILPRTRVKFLPRTWVKNSSKNSSENSSKNHLAIWNQTEPNWNSNHNIVSWFQCPLMPEDNVSAK